MLWGRVAKYVLWKAEEKWKANGWGLPFGGQHDNEYVLRGMMWADNYWLFCDNKERLTRMVNDIIEELLDLDMAQAGIAVVDKHAQRRRKNDTSSRGAETELGISPFVKSLKSWDTRYHRGGKGFHGAERTMCKPNASVSAAMCTAQP